MFVIEGDDTKQVVMHIIEGDNGYTQDSDDVEQDEHAGVGTQSLSQSQSQKVIFHNNISLFLLFQ